MAIADPLKQLENFKIDKMEKILGKGLIIPHNNHNAAPRKKMLNVHLDHRTELVSPELPYVDTLYGNKYGQNNSSYLLSDLTYEVVAKIPKFSHCPEQEYLVLLREPITNSYTVFIKKSYDDTTETYGYLYNTSYIDSKKPGDFIHQGDIIRKPKSYDDYGNKLDGTNLNLAFMNIAKTCEDGLLLSESGRKKFDSIKFSPVRININNNNIPLNLYGKNNMYKICPFVGEKVENGVLMGLRLNKKTEEFYSSSQDRLRKQFTSDKRITIEEGIVVDCNIRCNDVETLYSRPEYAQLAMIHQNQMRYTTEIVNLLKPIIEDPKCKKSKDLEDIYLYNKRILDGQVFVNEKDKEFSFVVIDFVVYSVNRLQIGDKITNQCGGKGVVAGFLPDELMPLLDNGKRLDGIANAAGITGRENATQEIIMETNFIGSRIIEKMRDIIDLTDEALELYLKFLEIAIPQEGAYMRNIIYNMSEEDRKDFLRQICSHDSIYSHPEPISESYGIDTLDKLYKAFSFVKPYKVMVAQEDSNGNIQYIRTRRDLVAGYVYYYRLKQNAEEKFSVTSLSATNVRGQNTRSRSSKLFEAPHSRTPKNGWALIQECIG